ncbi:hypothetical protein HDU96_010810 [Phlyctochytrium bullatum]|nr:hypothetical protein HDU96_010810 [Phlyctochytrium bullatum]
MPYDGQYDLSTRMLTEFLGTFMALFLGLAVVANELLPSTKGHGMGFGWIAFGFGFAFAVAIQLFSYASAHINPAACLALLVRGDLYFYEFLALVFAEMLGGLVAAVMVYLLFLPHFKTVPEIGTSNPEDDLLRTRDVITPSALRYASYNTKSSASAPKPLKDRLAEARYYLLNEAYDDAPEKVMEHLIGRTYHLHGIEVPFPKEDDDVPSSAPPKAVGAGVPEPFQADLSASTTAADQLDVVVVPNDEAAPKKKVDVVEPKRRLKRRHSLQVADMQRRLRLAERELSLVQTMDDLTIPARTSEPDSELRRRRPAAATSETSGTSTASNGSPLPPRPIPHQPSKSSLLTIQAREEALARAATQADQAMKLSVFATRPAIYLPVHNFFVECLGTATLIFGAFLIDDHLKSAAMSAGEAFRGVPLTASPVQSTVKVAFDASFSPMFKGFFIMVLVMGMGGPTGFAANPARDLAPRLAHFLLPIPGKGSSEWNYGIITNLASMTGGLLAGGLYSAAHIINNHFKAK